MNNEEKIERMMFNMLSTISQETEDKLLRFDGFERFYLFTNEHLHGFLKSEKLENKRVLTVGSSGDQILYSLINGATDIVCFDICPFAEHYFNLKVACIKNLTFNEFSKYIGGTPQILSPEVYAKISHSLPKETQEFWDHLFIEGFNNYEFNVHRTNTHLTGFDIYLNNKSLYNKLQKALYQNYKVEFIESDIREIVDKFKHQPKFDVILLSNIYQYARAWKDKTSRTGEEIFIDTVKDIKSLLNRGGVIQIDYAYSGRIQEKYNKFKDVFGSNSVTAYENKNITAGPILYRPDNEEYIEEL